MRLYCWRGATRNFGDELNTVLWPRLLPDFFDDDPAQVFLGIGSVLGHPHDKAAIKLVAGAGYGGYQPAPVLDARWVVHWVRGPRTARALGLPESCGLGDPAMLLSAPVHASGQSVGFMPHFESLPRGAWGEAAEAAGVTLIDPRDEPERILAAMGGCRLILSEAMHGVIVADAMRVPWVALRPLVPLHRGKWQDWADALGLRVRFQRLAASSLREHVQAACLGSIRRGRRLLDRAGPWLAAAARHRFVDRAAATLAAAAAAPPQLSRDTALDRCRARMLERVEALRRDPWTPQPYVAPARGSPASAPCIAMAVAPNHR
jgi:succinoglycan biosynthesis protein ExoV